MLTSPILALHSGVPKGMVHLTKVLYVQSDHTFWYQSFLNVFW